MTKPVGDVGAIIVKKLNTMQCAIMLCNNVMMTEDDEGGTIVCTTIRVPLFGKRGDKYCFLTKAPSKSQVETSVIGQASLPPSNQQMIMCEIEKSRYHEELVPCYLSLLALLLYVSP